MIDCLRNKYSWLCGSITNNINVIMITNKRHLMITSRRHSRQRRAPVTQHVPTSSSARLAGIRRGSRSVNSFRRVRFVFDFDHKVTYSEFSSRQRQVSASNIRLTATERRYETNSDSNDDDDEVQINNHDEKYHNY